MAWHDNDNISNLGGEAVQADSPRETVMEATTLSPAAIKQIGQELGLNVGTDADGSYMVLPADMANNADFNSQFIDYWVGASPQKQSVEQRRKVRNNAYCNMDTILGEAILTLDAYADEALGVGFIEQPIDITFSDKDIEKKVMNILKRSHIITRSRGHMRNLCKWGDLGAKIVIPPSGNDPEDIKVEIMTPDEWEAFFVKKGPVPLGYMINPTYGCKKSQVKKKQDILQPWEFIQFTVPDDEFAPYGRSLLEAMRTSFDQLVTIEALLALSRASRVERLVIKVPTGQTNPTAALSKINQVKSIWKNAIFNDKKKGKSSQARTPSLMDVMFMPSDEGFEIDRLASGSGVEISSTEDVEYFRNQVLMMSGLPKGYLLADESTDRYHSLAAQDLKFARRLIPYQDAYASGLTKLCMVLAGYCGADLENLEITVKIKRPVQTSDQLLQNYEAISRAAIEMIDNFKRSQETFDSETGEPKGVEVPPDLYAKLLAELGMPEAIIKLFDTQPANDPAFPANSPDDDKTSKATHGASTQGILAKYLADVTEKLTVACKHKSKEIYQENKDLFTFFRDNSSVGNLLVEVLENEGRTKPAITG